jgi:hypothetical protein
MVFDYHVNERIGLAAEYSLFLGGKYIPLNERSASVLKGVERLFPEFSPSQFSLLANSAVAVFFFGTVFVMLRGAFSQRGKSKEIFFSSITLTAIALAIFLTKWSFARVNPLEKTSFGPGFYLLLLGGLLGVAGGLLEWRKSR